LIFLNGVCTGNPTYKMQENDCSLKYKLQYYVVQMSSSWDCVKVQTTVLRCTDVIQLGLCEGRPLEEVVQHV